MMQMTAVLHKQRDSNECNANPQSVHHTIPRAHILILLKEQKTPGDPKRIYKALVNRYDDESIELGQTRIQIVQLRQNGPNHPQNEHAR
mmetsp:Transcript_12191/g.15210  ORF Transcript_12191/g.15210 Transcript_12191/m.15210 type:complete len:89 (+) Transcript_12191:120-386(+)